MHLTVKLDGRLLRHVWRLSVRLSHACAVFFAKLVADLFGRGLFETYLELSCVPILEEPMTSSSVSSVTNQLSVADVMAQGVTALPPVIAVSDLLHIAADDPLLGKSTELFSHAWTALVEWHN